MLSPRVKERTTTKGIYMGNAEALGNQSEDKETVLCFPAWSSLFKVEEFHQAAETSFGTQGIPHLAQTFKTRGVIPCNWGDWFGQGVECQLLRPGSEGWRKGKLKIEISLKFYPDELNEAKVAGKVEPEPDESPLDSIRQLTVE